ncbi:HNH endonuclease [Variovorax sp. N23]|uniref:HNH endonuclease n=1 Tax=Variovorax sp. N23 TaxID=2980555 RepID=UPI0021C6DCDF|nr:HNH endonuclease [Variovorax sp. N23]MCU4120766.1 HNH endonuclease [Variovorax sp. N23]
MTKPLLLCLLLATLPGLADARSKHRDHAEQRAFRQEHPCPTTGQAEGACPGWQVGYVVELCAGGQDKRENMRWLTPEDKRFIKQSIGKDCKKLKHAPLPN